MKAARRQARDWLGTMSLWLVQYVTWRDGMIREGRAEGVHQLLGILTALQAEDATLDRPQDTERVERHLQRLIEGANRVGDTELETALMNVESAVLYRPAHIVDFPVSAHRDRGRRRGSSGPHSWKHLGDRRPAGVLSPATRAT